MLFLLAASSLLSATTTAASILLHRCVRNMGSAQSSSYATLSASSAARSGDYRVDEDLNELRNETITVLETGLYRERCNGGRGIILHDFVGFRVKLEDGDIFKIKAEKSPVGISVTRPLRFGDVVTRYVCENLEDCGEIRMEDLLAILKEPSPDYDLMSDNCWSYADATFKQVIRRFSETPGLSPERRSYLASFLNNAPPVMPDDVLVSVGAAAGTAAVLQIPVYIVGVVAATAVAAVVAPTTLPEQVATFYIALRSAGIPVARAGAQNGLHAMTAAQAYGPQILRAVQLYRGGGVPTISATQAVAAPLMTRAFLYLVSLKPFIIKCAVSVAPFLGPAAWAVAGSFTAYALVKLFIFLTRDATSLGQSFNRRGRSLFSRRPLNQAQGLPPI